MKIKVVNKKRLIFSVIFLLLIVAILIALVVNIIKSKKTTLASSNVAQKNSIVTENTITNTAKNDITNDSKETAILNTNTITTSSSETTKLSTKRGLPVLMYHFFYDKEKDGEKGKDNNCMEVSAFEAQMKYLSDNNYYFPSWQEVEDFIDKKIGLPEKSVVITIDDGDQSFINYAIPIIEKYNVKATSFVVTSWNGDWLPETYSSSHLNFQSHSHDMHRAGANGKGRFVNLSYADGLADVTKSKEIIGDCTIFCYPFGHYNDTAIKALKAAGYKLAFTTKGGRVYQGAKKFELPRVRMSKGISLSAFKEAVK